MSTMTNFPGAGAFVPTAAPSSAAPSEVIDDSRTNHDAEVEAIIVQHLSDQSEIAKDRFRANSLCEFLHPSEYVTFIDDEFVSDGVVRLKRTIVAHDPECQVAWQKAQGHPRVECLRIDYFEGPDDPCEPLLEEFEDGEVWTDD